MGQRLSRILSLISVKEPLIRAWLAMMAAAVGIQDDAIRYAREAFEILDPFSFVWFSKIWPPSTRLRMDPRFARLGVDTAWLLK